MIELLPVDGENISKYRHFEECYHTQLSGFLSRIYPRDWKDYISLAQRHLLSWSYLKYDGELIGAIWLEKDTEEDEIATLGIFITREDCRGRGFGQQAIMAFISENAVEMGLKRVGLHVREGNQRAVACYLKCGFALQRPFVNVRGIPVIEMKKELMG